MEQIKTKKYKLANGELVSAGEGTAIRDNNGVLYRNMEDYEKGITARMRCEGYTEPQPKQEEQQKAETPEPQKPQPKQPQNKLSETGYRAEITFGNDMEACKKTPTTTVQTPASPPKPPTTSGNGATFEVLKVMGMRGRTLLTLRSLDGTTDVIVDTMKTPKYITLSKEGEAMVYANTQSTTPIVLKNEYIINL